MDYNWLENVPSSNTPIPVYQPDFSFLQSMQMRANMQYEQGLSQVKNAYSSIFNQPVIGTSAKKVQQDYARQAQEQMKDISASDLSDPKNVATAEKIMSPFYQDENLLTNIGLAKYYDGQDDKLNSWQNNTDKEIRSQYSDENRMALQYKRQEIAAAPFSATAYNKIEKIGAVPYFDINGEVDKAYIDEKNKGVDNVSIINGGVYTKHNGVESLDAFRNYYLSKVGNKYDGQMRVHAYVNMYRQRQDILTKNPGLDPNAVDHQLAQENIQSLNDGFIKNINSYNNIAGYWDSRAKDILAETKNGKTANQDQLGKIQFYQEQAKAHREAAGKYESQYKLIGAGNENSEEYKKFFRDLYEHPEQYVTQIDKQRMADAWATRMAYMNTGLKVALDPVREAYLTHREKAVDQSLKDKEIQAQLRGQNLTFEKETGIDPRTGKRNPNFRPDYGGWSRDLTGEEGTTNGIPKGGINPDGTINYAAWTAQGYNTTDVAHLAPDVLKQQQDIVAGQITKSVLDPKAGLITSLKEAHALSQNELIDLNGWASSIDKGVKPTDIQNVVFQKAVAEMKNKGIDVSRIRSSHDLQKALIDYTTEYAKQLKSTTVGDNLQAKHAIGTQLAVTAGRMQQQMQLYNENQQHIDQIQEQELKKDAYKKLSVVDPTTGKTREITPHDMAKDFPEEVELRETSWFPIKGVLQGDNDPRIKRFTGDQLATMFYNGQFKPTKVGSWGWGNKDIVIGDKKYELVAVKPRGGQVIHDPSQFQPDPHQGFLDQQQMNGKKNNPALNYFHEVSSNISKTYGDSKDFAELRNTFKQGVYGQLDFTKDGLITPRFGVDPSDVNTAELATRTTKEMSSPSVVPVIMNGDGTTPANSDDQERLRQVLMNKKSTEAIISNIYRTNTPDGSPAYGVVINPKGTDAAKNEEADFSQKTFILPVTSLENAPILANMPIKSNYLYQDLYNEKKSISADPIVKGYGQDFTVRGVDPGPDGKCTAAFVILNYTKPDGKGGISQENEKAYKIPMTGANGKGPDEIMKFVYDRTTEQMYKSDTILKNIQLENSREAAQYELSPQQVQQYSTVH